MSTKNEKLNKAIEADWKLRERQQGDIPSAKEIKFQDATLARENAASRAHEAEILTQISKIVDDAEFTPFLTRLLRMVEERRWELRQQS